MKQAVRIIVGAAILMAGTPSLALAQYQQPGYGYLRGKHRAASGPAIVTAAASAPLLRRRNPVKVAGSGRPEPALT